ncbi:DUF397 domain-containing protein [Streptosporangium nondiastaticum]|uniref:DUF397 domain-containing protein n=1 Tax=Streptosporangium nondiastaticum TaxID=35764 RepID=A0A9X7PFH4_9ACTN|nr:DUF397 domain-containing protein [Streptosporangium nondiastaticum]PSJ26079.1 DUF397 domain-containing protein [Streptosporangium nondiastaticum]
MSAGPAWFKSSYSGSEGSTCVEVAVLPQAIRIRDSKRKDGPHLAIAPSTWLAFVAYAPAAAR